MDELRDLADRAVTYAAGRGAAYCDVRAEESVSRTISIEDSNTEYIKERKDAGIGIRIAGESTWGFASISSPGSFAQLRQAVDSALEASARKSKNKIRLCNVNVAESESIMPVLKAPEIESVMELGQDCSKIISDTPRIRKSAVSVLHMVMSRYFASSEGAKIMQNYTDLTMEMAATSHESGLTQSVNTTEGGRGGMEVLDNARAKAAEISARATELLDARPAQMQKGTVVMDPDFVALLTHEIFGHPSEADRVLGKEMAWAGGAWWKGMIGEEIASEALSVYDDPTIPGSLGCYNYDEEGVGTKKTALVRDGVLYGHMQSRETAAVFGVEPTGNMRAAGYGFMPLVRMACTCIDRGDYTPEEMVREVRDGYLISGMKIPSIDMRRHNWSISCQYAHKIKDGKIGEMLRDIIVSGTAPEFFKSVDACGNDFATRPITNCGKGDPMQSLMMGNGGPSIRGVATVRSI
ncbi:MAG: TldD/PmbA family protein [Nitrosopumilus sp. D6]|nr:MAG: TldD/PmbA family protein [Nitrosopumilus sp. D6]